MVLSVKRGKLPQTVQAPVSLTLGFTASFKMEGESLLSQDIYMRLSVQWCSFYCEVLLIESLPSEINEHVILDTFI